MSLFIKPSIKLQLLVYISKLFGTNVNKPFCNSNIKVDVLESCLYMCINNKLGWWV